MAVLSKLVPVIAGNFLLQSAFASIFVPLQNERLYDLCGTMGYMVGAGLSLYYPSLRAKFWQGQHIALPAITSFAPRQLLLTGCLVLWSGRLGSFLVTRVYQNGGDSRFDEVKKQPSKFFGFWLAQATWISLVGLPVFAANILPAHTQPPLGARDYAGLAIFIASMAFETIADRQKSQWRKERDEKKHEEKFISRGLWSWSRHPNYVGEVGIWTGIWALSTTALSSPLLPSLMPWAAAVSPIFTYFLLTKVSGVPPLEKAGNKKFGDDPKWVEYKKNVPVFFPWGPKN